MNQKFKKRQKKIRQNKKYREKFKKGNKTKIILTQNESYKMVD